MSSEYPRPCKCGSRRLKPMWDEDTGERWVACEDCGNASRRTLNKKPRQLVAIWDEEQKENKKR